MKIYVASSWQNPYQMQVVLKLRADGHEVYDFRADEGFSWREVDTNWINWTPQEYLRGLLHPRAESGFNRDMEALVWCDALVMVMPCGPSASMEMGHAKGAGKPVAVWVPAIREPDLMVKMADLITDDFEKILTWLKFKPVKS